MRLRGRWHHARACSATRPGNRAWAITLPGSSRTASRRPTSGKHRQRGIDIHQLLEEKAAQLKPGESGLLALDWWNGNRSVLVDVDLTGLLLGATLATKPEEIYRALIEATAYGTRVIVEAFEKNGVPVTELVACGGLPEKNKLLMQIYADVTGREIKVTASKQTPALGQPCSARWRLGRAAGGYDSIFEAAQHHGAPERGDFQADPGQPSRSMTSCLPNIVRLHDYFGRARTM